MSLAAYPQIADLIGIRDGRLLVRTGKVDIGQRISTALAQIAHEELTIPHELIDVLGVETRGSPDEGITSGSNSIEQSGSAVRRASATLRTMLVARASERFGGDAADWSLDDGEVRLASSNHRISVLELIAGIDLATPVNPQAPLRTVAHDALPAPHMRGIADMVSGRFAFVHDLDVPGMLHARVVHPPHARARLRAIEPAAVARAEAAGMRLIRDGSFIALAGPQEWPVVAGALKLAAACDWDAGGGLPEADVFAQLRVAKATARLAVIDGTPRSGPVPEPMADPHVTARFERPYQMHGALAPSAAMAHWDGEVLVIHSHSQGIFPLRAAIAEGLDLKSDQVEVLHRPGSGCYGHNGADDAALEAALIAMAIPGKPVLLKWTREDEHGWEPYAPAMAVELGAVLDGDRLVSFSAEAFSDTHRGRPRPGPNQSGPAKLIANRFRANPIEPIPTQPNMGRHAGMHRNLDPIYAFADKRLVKNLVTGLPHRTSAMRTLGGAANIFAIESFVDEVARSRGIGPFAFRRAHLEDRRAIAVIDALERRVNRLPSLPESQGRGIAYAQYKNEMTRVGVSVDLEVDDRANVRLVRAVIVADAGRVVDAAGLSAQLEGGFVQAASWALYETVKWDRDGIQSRDWDSYPVLRFDNIPEIEVDILDYPVERSLGAGEASPGPTLAAIANAVFDATGIRMRRIPFTPQTIMDQALNLTSGPGDDSAVGRV